MFSQLGLYSTATRATMPSFSRGQWQLDNAYRYLNEAYGGYHFDALHGINVDAGIFLSYVGLFSFYQFDNWAIPAFLRFVEHALVLHGHTNPGLPHREVEDRALDYQRLANLRAAQRPLGAGRATFVASDAVDVDYFQRLRHRR